MRFNRMAWLAVVLGTTGVLLSGARAQNVDPKYLPPDTDVVFTVNFQQMLSSKVAEDNKALVDNAKKMAENALADKGAKTYLDTAGIDLFKDVTSLSVAIPSKDPEKGVVILEGSFNAEKIHAAAKAAVTDKPGSMSITTIGAQRVYEIPQMNDKTLFVTVIDANVILAGSDKSAFTAAIDQLKSGKSAELSKSFRAVQQTTSRKQSLSFVATGPALSRLAEKAKEANVKQAVVMLKSVDAVSLGVTLSKDVVFQVGVNAADAKTADELSQKANLGLASLRGLVDNLAKQDEKLAPAADIARTLRVVTQGNNVVLTGEVSYENLGKIIKAFPQQGFNQ